MSRDIAHILAGWDFDPNRVSVRIIQGDDGRELIQMRLDLGLLQMELDGRPDGTRPCGCESWLDHYIEHHRKYEQDHPDEPPLLLEREDCDRLLREGVQYYHRYLSFWHLGRYELCARDTNRNLKLFKFVREYAKHDHDKRMFDQWRPYVIMMHTRAVATPLIEVRQYEAALTTITAGINGIQQFLEDYEQTHRSDQCAELMFLERWRDELTANHAAKLPAPPLDPLEELRKQLTDAIADERFEEAARLRDEIRRMSQTPFHPGADEKL